MKIWVLLGTYLITYIPLLIFFAYTPFLTRKTESFGVGIPEEVFNLPEVAAIRKKYCYQVLVYGSLLAIVILMLLLVPTNMKNFSNGLLGIGIFLEIGLMFYLYLNGHNRMKELKAGNKGWSEERRQVVVVETSFHQKRLLVSPLWFALYPLVILATILVGVLMYKTIPEQVPLHYSIYGEVDQWARKSIKLLFFAPLIQFFCSGLMVFVYWIVSRAKQQVDPARPELSIAQNRAFRYQWSAFIVFTGLAMVGIFGLLQLAMVGLIRNPIFLVAAPLGITGLIVVAAIWLSFSTGQGGSRLAPVTGDAGRTINRDEDCYWKLGMFYYNPDDPALFVEKRFGIGWTSNFARPLSWFLIVGLIILILVLTQVTKSLTR